MAKSEFVQNANTKSLKTLAPALQAGGTTIRGLSGHRVQVVLHAVSRALERAPWEVHDG